MRIVARYENGRGSERFYNLELHTIYEALKYLIYDNLPEDDTIINNALTFGGENKNELFYRKNGAWNPLFADKFKIIDEILLEERPLNPVEGQLWLDHGVLTYWNGRSWELAKTAYEAEYSINAYEQFLLIEELQKGLNLIVDTHKTYIEETFEIKSSTNTISLLKGTYEPNSNKIAIYINGRFISSSLYTQTNNKTITFTKQLNPLTENIVTIQYLPQNSLENNNYFIRFNSSCIEETFTASINQKVFTVTRGTFLANQNQVEVYVGGRYLAHSNYTETNNTTITLQSAPVTAAGQDTVEVTILYIDSASQPASTYQEVSPVSTMSQLIWPSSQYDRLFINGENTIDYREVNKISIEMETDRLINNDVSALHINPQNISGIEKTIFKVSAINSFIPVPTANTEVYGINSNYGTLLFPDKGGEVKDYAASASGITLNQHTIENYDFIMTVTYYFKTTTGRGQLIKGHLDLSNGTSFFVGHVNEPIVFFYHGLALTNEQDYYYDTTTGCVQIYNAETGQIDMGAIVFPKVYYGTVTTANQVVIPYNAEEATHFKNVIIFVNGLATFYSAGDITINTTVTINNVLVGMEYIVVECTENDGIRNMHASSGVAVTTNNETYIPLPTNMINDKVIVFVDGLLIAQNDVRVDYITRKIFINHLVAGQKYILLKDINNRYIFSNYVAYNCVGLPKAVNSLMVYVDGKALVDFNDIYSPTSIAEPGKENQVKYVVEYDDEGIPMAANWHIYTNNEWQMVLDAEKFDTELIGFMLDRNMFSLPDGTFNDKLCTFYGYQYDHAIENPLVSVSLVTSPDNKTAPVNYYTGFNGYYKLNTNALSVFVDGIRQYPSKSNFPDGVKEVSNATFELPAGYEQNLPILCIIERLEGNEYVSCENEVLYAKNVIPGSSNIFATSTLLSTGILRVFIGGLRIPSSQLKIISQYALQIKDYVSSTDPILLEVRKDYSLKEQLIEVRINGQNRFSVADDNLNQTLIESGDLIAIYVNGYRYQGTYKIDKNTNAIVLQDNHFYNRLRIKDQIIFEWR